MAKAAANGITLEYERFGPEDGAPLLLISGLGTQMLRWTTPFCQTLAARDFSVIRFDNRDAGLSTHLTDCPVPDFATLSTAIERGQKPDVPYTLEDMAADAVGLLDALSIEQAHLVGRSMGGMIAQLIASLHQHLTLSLSSIMSSTGNPRLPKAAPDVMAMLTRPAPHPSLNEEGYLSHCLAFARRIGSPGHPFDEAAQRALIIAETQRSYDPAGTGRQIAAIAATGDLSPHLAKITAPTLVVHSANDPLVPPAAGEDTAACIPGADLMMIDGMGHDLPPALYEPVVNAITTTAGLRSRQSRQ